MHREEAMDSGILVIMVCQRIFIWPITQRYVLSRLNFAKDYRVVQGLSLQSSSSEAVGIFEGSWNQYQREWNPRIGLCCGKDQIPRNCNSFFFSSMYSIASQQRISSTPPLMILTCKEELLLVMFCRICMRWESLMWIRCSWFSASL